MAYALEKDKLITLTTNSECNLVVDGKPILPSHPQTPEEKEKEQKSTRMAFIYLAIIIIVIIVGAIITEAFK